MFLDSALLRVAAKAQNATDLVDRDVDAAVFSLNSS
jgi:hypothetical protein